MRVGSESALRFDVPTLRLHLFGAVVSMHEFFAVLLLVLSLAFFFIWLTVAFGRIWCGWLCPQTVFVDLTGSEGRGRAPPPVALALIHSSLRSHAEGETNARATGGGARRGGLVGGGAVWLGAS